jgi:hypothetical protein
MVPVKTTINVSPVVEGADRDRETVERHHQTETGDQAGQESEQEEQVPSPEPVAGEGICRRHGDHQCQQRGANANYDTVEERFTETRSGDHSPIGIECRVRGDDSRVGEYGAPGFEGDRDRDEHRPDGPDRQTDQRDPHPYLPQVVERGPAALLEWRVHLNPTGWCADAHQESPIPNRRPRRK